MKKILAIALALVMVFALSVSVFAEEAVYTLTATQGQDSEAALDGGVAIASSQGDNYFRIATNWVSGGSVYNDILAAVQTADAVVKLTYTGTVTTIGFQTENGSYEMIDVTDVTEVDGKNVAIIPCADIVAGAPVAVANDNVGWGNFMVSYEGDATLYGFEVVTGYEAAAPEADAEPEETDAEPEPEAPAAEPEAPAAEPAPAPAPATGIALAVVPAVMALAAVAVSKKH